MAERDKLTLLASRGTVDAWRAAAHELGYVIDRGTFVNQGSISQLMAAIAGGEVDGVELMQAMSVSVARDDMGSVSEPRG